LVTKSSDDLLVNPYSPPSAEPAVVSSSIAVRFTGDFLLKGGSGRLIVVRSDMFELGGHWERFVTLAK
jgi:hypothetical protein